MSREIKFRAWDGVMMREGFLLHQANGSVPLVDVGGSCASLRPQLEWEVMQFTGLIDDNGNELYEGDVVQKGTDTCEVIFSKKAAKFCVRLPSHQWFGTVKKVYALTGCEVIGNIYENPELLEKVS